MARINRKDFRRHKDQALSVNIRLRKVGGDKPSKAEVLDVLQTIMDSGRVPKGWQFGAIDWRRPHWATKDWRHGKIADMMGNLANVLAVMIDDARVGLVRGTEWEIEIGMEYQSVRESDEGELVSTMRIIRIAKENLLTILGDSEAQLTADDGHHLEMAVSYLHDALTSLDSIK